MRMSGVAAKLLIAFERLQRGGCRFEIPGYKARKATAYFVATAAGEALRKTGNYPILPVVEVEPE